MMIILNHNFLNLISSNEKSSNTLVGSSALSRLFSFSFNQEFNKIIIDENNNSIPINEIAYDINTYTNYLTYN